MLALAHLGHWYESALFATPLVVIGVILWRSARKDAQAGEGAAENWDSGDGWRDPRLRDDDRDDV